MRIKILLFITLFSFNLNFFAEGKPENKELKQAISETEKEKIENQEYIQHHILDSHDFVISSDKKNNKHLGFHLPVIFYDNGLQIFSSSKFEYGEKVAENNGNYYTLFHEKIYKTNKEGDLKLDAHGHPTVEKITFDFSITKNVVMLLFTSILMILLFITLANSYKNNALPKAMVGRMLEPLILFIRDDIAIPNIGEKKYKKFLGYLLTVFFFILILNVLGLMPFGVNVTGNITITLFLSLLTYLIVQISANADYWKHIFWMPGVPVPMKLILAPIELLGTLTKPFALMIRLFANMSAGHIVVMSLIALIYYFKNVVAGVAFPVLTFVIYLLEVLVAFLQAYIFTMLSALFIGMAVQDHDHEHAH